MSYYINQAHKIASINSALDLADETIMELDQNWLSIYDGLAKHGRSQNIMYPS